VCDVCSREVCTRMECADGCRAEIGSRIHNVSQVSSAASRVITADRSSLTVITHFQFVYCFLFHLQDKNDSDHLKTLRGEE
jgi:hypothetical protein